MSTQSSLQDLFGEPRLVAGEEHLRSGTPDLNPGQKPEPQAEKTEPEKVEKGEQSATPAQTDASKKPEADKPAEKDVWDDPDGETIPRGVYVATRNKWRQKADETARELAELRGRLSAFQEQRQPQQQTQDQPQRPDFYGEPEKHVAEVAKSEAQRVAAQVANVMHEQSRRQLMRQNTDFAEAEAAFLDAARADGGVLFARMQAAVSTGQILQPEFAYETGKQIVRMRKLGVNSLDELETKLREEAEKKAEEKYRKDSALAAAERASTSSAGARGSGASSGPVSQGRRALSAMFPGYKIKRA